MSSNDPTELLTPREAAPLLRSSIDYVWQLCRTGKLKHMRKGNQILIKRGHIEEYKDAQIEGGE